MPWPIMYPINRVIYPCTRLRQAQCGSLTLHRHGGKHMLKTMEIKNIYFKGAVEGAIGRENYPWIILIVL